MSLHPIKCGAPPSKEEQTRGEGGKALRKFLTPFGKSHDNISESALEWEMKIAIDGI